MNIINPNLYSLLSTIGIILLGVLLFVIVPALRIIATHFDKEFPFYANNKDVFENGWWILSKSCRGSRYAGCMMFKNATKKRAFCRVFFQGYDFRKNARKIDWIIALSVPSWLAVILILGLITWIANGFHWPS